SRGTLRSGRCASRSASRSRSSPTTRSKDSNSSSARSFERGGDMKTIVAMLLALTAFAAQAAELKIGFVNTERVFREAAPAKRAQQKLEREFAARNSELSKVEKQGRDLQNELERENVTMPDATRREKERQLADISRNFQRLQREIREDLNLRRNEELAAVQE